MSMTMSMDMTSTTSSAVDMSSTAMSTSMSSSSMMAASSMEMVFFAATSTPLWSQAWTPATTGQYAGTCIFLIALAVIHRLLTAARNLLFANHSSLSGPGVQRVMSEDGQLLGKESPLARARDGMANQPFRVATEAWRAFMEVIIGGVGYLLMLAVMTFNVGYFLSVLGGIFLGAFIAGRFAPGGH